MTRVLVRWIALSAMGTAAVCGQESAPVVLDGRELWTVRSSRAGFRAAERAADIQDSLLHVATDPRRQLSDLREVQLESESILLVGRVYLFSVTDEDARLEGKSREALFRQRRGLAVDAIRRYREARSWWLLARSGGLALLALASACLGWFLLRWLGQRLQRSLHALVLRLSRRSKLTAVVKAVEGPLTLLFQFVVRVCSVAVALLVGFVTVSYILGLFPATAGMSETALSAMAEIARGAGQRVVAYLPNLLVLFLVGAFTYVMLLMAKALAKAAASGLVAIPGFHRDWAEPTYDLARIILILFALVVAFPYLPGGDSPALKGASIFIGVLVSLGSGSAMGNVIAGVILTYMRPFRLGDRVKIAESVGDVVERSLLVTRIKTIKNVELIVPNSAVLGAHIVNYSANAREQGLILSTSVTIGYDAPWSRVEELLVSAALRTGHILPDPRPFVLQTSLNDYHVSYEINAFTREANLMANTYSELHRNIQEEFHGAGVEIMSPAFLALRDGNTAAIPAPLRKPGHGAEAFRITMTPGPQQTFPAQPDSSEGSPQRDTR